MVLLGVIVGVIVGVVIGFQLEGLANLLLSGVLGAVAGWTFQSEITRLMNRRLASDQNQLLKESFATMGVGFAALFGPLFWDMSSTSGLWSLEGACVFWLGMRQNHWAPRAFGLLLQVTAAYLYIVNTVPSNEAPPLLNPTFMGAILIALPGLVVAWGLRQPLATQDSHAAKLYAKQEQQLGPWWLWASWAFWCIGWVMDINNWPIHWIWGAYDNETMAYGQRLWMMWVLVTSAAVLLSLGLKFNWQSATQPARCNLLIMVLTIALNFFELIDLFHIPLWGLWPLTLIVHYLSQYFLDKSLVRAVQPGDCSWHGLVHAGSAWLVMLLIAQAVWNGMQAVSLAETDWSSVILLLLATFTLKFMTLLAGRANQDQRSSEFFWPLQKTSYAYYWLAAYPLAWMLGFQTLILGLESSGLAEPWPYIPLLNPIDLSMGLALYVLHQWLRVVKTLHHGSPRLDTPLLQAGLLIGLLGFAAINTVWLRVAHQILGVDWEYFALVESWKVQTGYVILWTLMALALMLWAHHRHHRFQWQVGAALQALVVIKLYWFDLSKASLTDRIVALMVVGALMLLVSFFAPLPPQSKPDMSEEG